MKFLRDPFSCLDNRYAILVVAVLWHFVMLPIGLLWSLTLLGYDGGLTWNTFLGAMFFLVIIRSAVASIPYK